MVLVERFRQRRQIRRATQRALIFHRIEPQLGVAAATVGTRRADDRFDDEAATGPVAVTDDAPTAAARISTTLTFRSTPRRWYRTRQAAIALAAATAVAAIAVVVLIFWRGHSASVEESPTVAPSPANSATPSAEPVPATGPPSALPPPPPPPSPAESETAPAVTGSNPYPRYAPPDDADGPEIGVTRTPVTRAPISVAPSSRPTPGTNSATPGDGRKRWRPF